jgi:tetratricopeptide (TPR) repeat protein
MLKRLSLSNLLRLAHVAPRLSCALALALAASSFATHAQTKSTPAQTPAPTQKSAPNANEKQRRSGGESATRARRVGTQRTASSGAAATTGDAAKTVETKNAPGEMKNTPSGTKIEASETKAATSEKKSGAQSPNVAGAPNVAGSPNAAGEPKPTEGETKPTVTGETKPVADEAKTAVVAPKPETPEVELSRRRAEIASASPQDRVGLRRALVDRLVELNMSGEALEELRLMVHEDRFDPAFFYNTGNALARLGDANAAADAYRKAISQRKGNYARALNNLGVVLTRQGRWDEAYDALVAALTQENFNYAEASYNLGRLYLLRGEANMAIREWTRTLQLEPDHVAATSALARAYAEDGNSKRALAVLENFTVRAARTGDGVPREIAYAREEINSGIESDAAAKESREAAPMTTGGALTGGATSTVAPSSVAPGSNARGANARPASSQRSTLRAFSVDPQTHAMLQSARDANENGKYDDAIKRYRNVLARSGGYLPPANLELGSALMNLKRNDEAIVALAPVAAHDGARYPVVHYHLARLYERQGQLALSAQHFARAAELYGDAAPQLFFDLSRVREKLGDDAGALVAMESYIESIKRQGSVPDWASERLNNLRARAKGTTAQKPLQKNATP